MCGTAGEPLPPPIVPLVDALCMSWSVMRWSVRPAALLSLPPVHRRFITSQLINLLPLISIATKYLYPFFFPPFPIPERHPQSKSTRLLFLDASSNQLSMTTGRRRTDQSEHGILLPALFARHSLFIDSAKSLISIAFSCI